MPVSKTQIDRLGDRLKTGAHTESDLRLLDDYRRLFGEAYREVVRTIRRCGELPTGRPAKSTASIAEKLRRESIRLSQMQDIAGCRVVVTDVMKQEQFVRSLRIEFPGASVIDRRDNPSFGYRAVHLIAEISGKPVEIQVRTALQHLWAEVSEKSSDVLDSTIKYGGGPELWRNFLTESFTSVAAYEEGEKALEKSEKAHKELEKSLATMLEDDLPDQELQRKLEELRAGLVELRAEKARVWNVNADLLNKAISWLDERAKEPKS